MAPYLDVPVWHSHMFRWFGKGFTGMVNDEGPRCPDRRDVETVVSPTSQTN